MSISINSQSSPISLPLSIIATALLGFGALAIYAPKLLQQNLPSTMNSYFSQYDWLAIALCVVGVCLHVMVMMTKFKKSKSAVGMEFADKTTDTASSDTDQLSQLANWIPARGRVTHFYTPKLVSKSNDTMAVTMTNRTLILLGSLLIASIIAAGSIGNQLVEAQTLDIVLIPLAIGAVFFTVGTFSLYNLAQPMMFDRKIGYFWYGFKCTTTPSQLAKGAKPTSRIQALQIIAQRSHGNKNCELNLVMTDSSRINVMEHTCPDTLTRDARKLAEFLGVPILA